MNLQVAYSSDNNYAQHVGVSMLSLFENNKEFANVSIYILDNNISAGNKAKLLAIVEEYGRKVIFVEVAFLLEKLPLKIGNSIAISSYARLFLASVIPDEADRIIYLDCDSIINGSLAELWQTDLDTCHIGGVADTVSQFSNNYAAIGLAQEDTYVNAGVLLIDLNKWRLDCIEQKLFDFIRQRNGKVCHHDQGTINGVLHNSCKILHPQYNAMSVFFSMTRKQMIKYYNMIHYYSAKELKEAVNKPVIIHYTPGFVGRPWIKGCIHPMGNLYMNYFKMSPWRNEPLQKDSRGLNERIVMFLYNKLPFELAHFLCKMASGFGRR